MDSFNIYKNTQMKKAKYVNKHFLEILNTQLKFELFYMVPSLFQPLAYYRMY